MINWISSEDEKKARKVNFENLVRVMQFVNQQDCNDEMVNYAKQIYREYANLLSTEPLLLKEALINGCNDDFVIDGDLRESDVIVSPSDLNSYYTIKELNKDKKYLTVVCFDMHSDTYDYNDFLWKGNSFSMLMKEGYINHYIVIGVPKHKRQNCMDDTNEDLRSRVHLIDENELFDTLDILRPENIFVSIDADALDCRRAGYTAVEYSPATILNHISYIDEINESNYIEKIKSCIHVKNELGYSNYYHTGENDITKNDIIRIVNSLSDYCNNYGINLGLNKNEPYYQIMEISGYDYGNLTSEMIVELIYGLSKKEVRNNGKARILKKN